MMGKYYLHALAKHTHPVSFFIGKISPRREIEKLKKKVILEVFNH